jgi:hypothetical protein
MIEDASGFVEEFLKEYLEKGFGTLSKRDTEVLIFYLLNHYGYFGPTINYFDASKKLKISETRVRNLFQDVQLRYAQYDENEAKKRFVRLVEEGRLELDSKGRYKLQVSEPLLNQYVYEWVDQVKGVADTSFSSKLIVLSKEVFVDVIEYLSPYDSVQALIEILPSEVDDEVTSGESTKGVIRKFLEKHIDILQDEVAKTLIHLGVQGLIAILNIV